MWAKGTIRSSSKAHAITLLYYIIDHIGLAIMIDYNYATPCALRNIAILVR